MGGYIGIMEKKMETTNWGLGFLGVGGSGGLSKWVNNEDK